MNRIIGHLDMDAFFAAAEERENSRFKRKPIVVGADPVGGAGRGVVSTANYKAREYGIHSAMPISTAWRLAEQARKRGMPETIFLGGNFALYGKISDNIMKIIRRHAPVVEEASIDEAYFDLTNTGNFEEAAKVAQKIKDDIRREERLTSTVGIGPNKLVAKIASDLQKPDGLTIVRPEDVQKVFDPLSVRKMPGIGPKSEERLRSLGIKTVADLKKLSAEKLDELFGAWGREMYEKARGEDDSPLEEEYEAKSIGEQETFMEDTLDAGFLVEHLKGLAQSVYGRFKSGEFSAEGGSASGGKTFKTIAITVRFADFETKTRAHTLSASTSDKNTLLFEATRLFMPFLDSRENAKKKKIRLLGVRIEKFE